MQGTLAMEEYFNEIAIFIGELRGLLEVHEIEMKTASGVWFKRDGRATRIDSSREWVTTYLTFAFGKKEWLFSSFWDDSYLFVRFYLDDDEECKMLFGYSIRTKGNDNNQNLILMKKDEIISYLRENNEILLLVEPWSEMNYEYFSGEDLKPDILNREILDDVYRTELCNMISFEELSSPNLINDIRNKLINIADFIIKIGITPNELKVKKR